MTTQAAEAPVWPGRVITRYAPSPTGRLHLGHVLNAMYTWGMARALGGAVLLRIEDHDRGRCRAEFEHAIHEDLAWLGFVPDSPPRSAFAAGACDFRQSDCHAVYAAALERLRARTHVYACACSRKEIVARTGGQGEDLRYDGYCRKRGLPPGGPHGLRVELPAGHAAFNDLLQGAQVQEPARETGDLLLRDRHGNWTYHFCVVVDDLRQGVNLVVRGADLLGSTGRQVLLARLLGAESSPAFAHHPLITGVDGEKLSKRDGAEGIGTLRAAGVQPEDVLRCAAKAACLPWPLEFPAPFRA